MWRRPIAATAATATIIAMGAVAPAAWADEPGAPVYGDLNGDQVLDRAWLGAAPPRQCGVLVELGRPEGGYLPPRRYTYQAPGGGASTACPNLGVAVDLDRAGAAQDPGVAELVVGWYGGTPERSRDDLLVLRNFTVSSGFPAFPRPNFLGLADFDGDARLDLYVWTDQGDGFATYLNEGTGTLRPGPVRYCSGPLVYRLADFDRDGATDVAIAYVDGCADGSQGVVVVLDDGTVVELQNMADGELPWTIHVMNADRDTVPDVLTYLLPAAQPTLFLGVGDGSFVRSPLAVQDAVTVSGTAPSTIPLLANDWASLRARVSIVTPPTVGAVRVDAGRTIVYTPGATPGVADRFVYRLSQDGRTSDAAVLVKIAP